MSMPMPMDLRGTVVGGAIGLAAGGASEPDEARSRNVVASAGIQCGVTPYIHSERYSGVRRWKVEGERES